MKIVTVIQARRGSTRLPDKVLMPVLGKPILIHQIERVLNAKLVGDVVIATTDEEKDNVIVDLCNEYNFQVFRGHRTDLLDRHYQLAKQYHADAVVKIPSDCPLIDSTIIDNVISFYIQNYPKFDYVSNLHPSSWPDGNDVEIMSMQTLENAWQHAKKDFEREHTTPYIWENPHLFKIGEVIWEIGQDFSTSHRWTLDYQEDFEFIKTVYEELHPINPQFGLLEILTLLDAKPQIALINAKYSGQYWYKNHIDQLNHIDSKWKNK